MLKTCERIIAPLSPLPSLVRSFLSSCHTVLLQTSSTHQAHLFYLFSPLNVSFITHISKWFPLTPFRSMLPSLLIKKAFLRHTIWCSVLHFVVFIVLIPTSICIKIFNSHFPPLDWISRSVKNFCCMNEWIHGWISIFHSI